MNNFTSAGKSVLQISEFLKAFMGYRFVLLSVFVVLMGSQFKSNAQIAAWTFDATAAAPSTPSSVAANLGTQSGAAFIYADGTNGSSTWITATTGNELSAFGGSTTNDPRGTAVAGNSYCPIGGTGNSANGKSMVIKFSMTGLENPILTFATRGTSTGFSTHQWAWSTDNSTYTNFGTNTAVITTTFLLKTLDMSAINALDGAAVVYLRITFSGATGTTGTGNNRLDNLVINATTVAAAPVINSSLTANATVGQPFNYTITATNSPSSFSSSTLPVNGLNLTGAVISGTPTTATAPATQDVSITATNGTGSDTKTLAITVNKGSQTISGLPATDTRTFGDLPYNLTATGGGSGNPVTYLNSNPLVASISGNQVTIVGVGTTVITASQMGNSDWNAATDVPQTLTVNQASQVITFNALPDKLDTDADFTLNATGGASGNPITYESSNTSVATITGNLVHIVSAGTTTITASQVGNANYAAAVDVSQVQTVLSTSLLPQVITFNALPVKTYGDLSFQLTATGGGSGNPVTYISSNTAVATIAGDIVTIKAPGSTTITASQLGNAVYNPATPVDQVLTVNQKEITLSGSIADDKPYDGFTIATISGYTVNGIVGIDNVTITGGGNFTNADAGTWPVTASLGLGGTDQAKYYLTQPTGLNATILKLSQTITGLPASDTRTFGAVPYNLNATGGASGNPVTYESSDPLVASIIGNTVTINGAGVTTITASQAGATNYDPAVDVLQSLTVNQTTQFISFSSLPSKTTADAPFALTATASSTLAVTYNSTNPLVATISGNIVTIVGVGVTNIVASQSGNSNYFAASDVTRTLTVTGPLIAAWDFTGMNTVATAAAALFNTNLASSNLLTRGAGATASVGANSFRTTGFQNNGISIGNTDYFQFTLGAVAGRNISISDISAKFAGTSTFYASPGVSSQLAYSLDGITFTLIGSPVQSTSLALAPINTSGVAALQNVPSGTTITFRYYASGQTSTGGWGFTSASAGDYGLMIGGSVSEPPPTATYTQTNVSACAGSPDGSIIVAASGGVAPYTYSWTGMTGIGATVPFSAGNTSSLTGLNIGYYSVTITDAASNVTTINNIHIQYAYSVYITNSGTNSSSCGNTGSIIIYGNSGVQPYTYSLDGTTYQSSNTFIDLAAATYTAYVKDASGCVSSKLITIAAAQPLLISPFVRAASSCNADGSIEIYRTGGIPPYTYSIDGSNYGTNNKFFNLNPGNYIAYVKDSKGCITQQAVAILQGAAITVNLIQSSSSACVNDGAIVANASGGIAPYTYSLDGVNYQTSKTFTDLTAGTYTVYVKDVKNCVGSASISVALNPIVVTATATAASNCASTNGSIQLFRVGGTGPYTYSIDGNNYQASNLFSALTPGYYDVFVKDAKFCIGQLSNVLVAPDNCFTRSKISSLQAPSNEWTVSVYPNPTSDAFLLSNLGFNGKQFKLIITDVTGRVIYQVEKQSVQQVRFGQNLKPGVYQLQVIQGDHRKTMKIIKQ